MSWMGRWFQCVMLARVPLLLLTALAALALPGNDGPPTLVNMRIMASPFDLGLTVFVTLLACVVGGHHVLQIWQLAPARFGVPRLKLHAYLQGRGALRRWPFALFSLPLVWRLWSKNAFDQVDSDLGLWPSTLAVLAGFATLFVLSAGVERLRQKMAGWLDRVESVVRIVRWLGDGYWNRKSGRIEPGHALAVSWAMLMAVLYVAGYFLLHPARSGHDLVPTMVYVLGLLMLSESVLSGASFFLDKFRVPLLLFLLVYAGAMNMVFPRDHYFEVRSSPVEPPSLQEAVAARLDLQRQYLEDDERPILTLVAATGGGIQAAGWTAQVLSSLQRLIGEDLTRSVHLFSSASGGSVGAYYFFRGADRELGAPREETLDAIFRATTSSSLEATAWGFVYPAFLRGFMPLLAEPRLDRAWAMERSWLEAADRMLTESGARDTAVPGVWLSDWMRAAGTGQLPGVIFGSTVVEDGSQVLLSNLDLPELKEHYPDPGGQTLPQRYPGLGAVDLPVVSAARLSATFPYVTPQARAIHVEGGGELPGWHLADGGYSDNSGLVAALEWLLEVGSSSDSPEDTVSAEGMEPVAWGEALQAFSKIALVQISAFPPECSETSSAADSTVGPDLGETRRAEKARDSARGWFYSVLGPVLTIVRVRTATQVSRNDLELELLERFLDERVEPFVFRPPPRCDNSQQPPKMALPETPCLGFQPRDPPLSWQLSNFDRQTLLCDWLTQENQAQAAALDELFRTASAPPSRVDE